MKKKFIINLDKVAKAAFLVAGDVIAGMWIKDIPFSKLTGDILFGLAAMVLMLVVANLIALDELGVSRKTIVKVFWSGVVIAVWGVLIWLSVSSVAQCVIFTEFFAVVLWAVIDTTNVCYEGER